MTQHTRSLSIIAVALWAAASLAAPGFGQSTVANSAWNGGTGPWNSAVDWVTNGSLALATPNNGDMVLCTVGGVLQSCKGFFNVTIGTGGNDLVTLDTLPVTIDSLTLGASTGSAALDIGSSVADTLTVGDITAPVVAPAVVTVNSNSTINVFAGSTLDLNIAAGNGTVTNNGTINLNAVSGTGSSLLINDAGNTHQLVLTGSGTLTMQPGSVIQGVSGDEYLQNNSTMQGSGTISNLFVSNNGTIDANGTAPLVIKSNPNPVPVFGLEAHNGAGFVNTGTAEVNAGSTLVLDTTGAANTEIPMDNILGVISVNDGGTLEVVGAANHTTGFGNAFGAQINVGGTGVGGTLQLDGSNATFDLTPFSPGAGTLTLSNNIGNTIAGVTGTETLINDTGEMLSGAGTISNLALVNNGTILANGTNPLNIEPTANGFTNNGILQVNSGSTLALNLTAAGTAGTTGLTNSGTITVADGGILQLNTAGFNGAITLNNAGAIQIGGTGAGGTVDLQALNAGSQNFDVTGTGSITLSDNANNRLTGVTGRELLNIGNGQTLSGAGSISNLVVVNNGTIIANGKNPLNIAPSTPLNSSGFFNAGTVQVNSGSTLNASLSATAFGTGLSNSGVITVANEGTLNADLSNTIAGTGFSNSGTVNVQDGGTLEFTDTAHGTAATINNFQGNINLGQSTGAQLLLNDGGNGATFHLLSTNGVFGAGKVTMVNSTIEGATGDETLLLDFADVIEGTGAISNLNLTSAPGNLSEIVANGGTLKINAKLTNLSGGTLNGGAYQAGDTASGILQLPGDVTTNSAFLIFEGSGSAITDPSEKNALAGLSTNANGGNLAIDGGASLTINNSLTNGSPASPSGIVQLAGGGSLTVNGNLTNWGQIETGQTEGPAPVGSTINVTGEISNNFRSGDVQDFIELDGSGDLLNAGSFENSATVSVNSGAKITAGNSYTQTGGSTDVDGTLISPAISVTGGTFASNGGMIETTTLKSGASITADSTGFIGVGSGKFTATHGYQQLANGTLDELISGKSAFGVIDVTGPASLNGTLDVMLENGFIPTVGEQFAFLDFTKGDLTGTFANFLGQTFDNGHEDWDLAYNNATVKYC